MHRSIQSIVDEVFDLYVRHGADDYIGEAISQIEHASQSAQLAEQAGHDEGVILAAFLHDIGHICGELAENNRMGDYGRAQHEKVGADYLRARGFPEEIAQLIENHVRAKRYLTFKRPEYYARLSPASVETLRHQGGPMTEAEAEAFEAEPLFGLSIKMRAWDELAKEVAVPLVELEWLKGMAVRVLEGLVPGEG